MDLVTYALFKSGEKKINEKIENLEASVQQLNEALAAALATNTALNVELSKIRTQASMAQADYNLVSDEMDEAFIIANNINGEEA